MIGFWRHPPQLPWHGSLYGECMALILRKHPRLKREQLDRIALKHWREIAESLEQWQAEADRVLDRPYLVFDRDWLNEDFLATGDTVAILRRIGAELCPDGTLHPDCDPELQEPLLPGAAELLKNWE